MSKKKDKLKEFTFVDKGLIENALMCTICSRYLNVAPIIFSEVLGSICGRCNTGSDLNNLGSTARQKSLEEIIEYLTFPCINKSYGCEDILRFSEVLEHENTCGFQRTNCPLVYKQLFPTETKCTWTGSSKALSDHLRDHPNKFLEPPQFEWPNNEENKIFFTTVGNQIITIVIKHEKENKFACLVMLNGTDLESQYFRYQLEMSNEDKSHSLILRRNRLEPLSELTENIDYPEKTLEVNIDMISELLQNPKTIFARFGIAKKTKKELRQVGDIKSDDSDGSAITCNQENISLPDVEMLSELECPICNEFMIPPIHICQTGHSICNECRKKIDVCPTCRLRFANGRNFTLEKLTLKVKYSCRNREMGCLFVSTSDKIKQHQKKCQVSQVFCFLKCGWQGNPSAMYRHCLVRHEQLVHDAYFFSLLDYNFSGSVLLPFDNKLFYFVFDLSSDGINFDVFQLKQVPESTIYKYTVQFTTQSNETCPLFSFTNFCSIWHNEMQMGPQYDRTHLGATFHPSSNMSARSIRFVKAAIEKVR